MIITSIKYLFLVFYLIKKNNNRSDNNKFKKIDYIENLQKKINPL